MTETLQSQSSWLRLDNTAKIFPPLVSRRYSSLFRLAFTTDAPVRLSTLQEALEQTLDRMPYFRSRLRRGLFWYALQARGPRPSIQVDLQDPCLGFSRGRHRSDLVRVRVYNRTIAVETSHILSDGTGTLAFARALVGRYLELRDGEHFPDWGEIPHVGQQPDPAEWRDVTQSLPHSPVPAPDRPSPAYHMPGRLLRPGRYAVTHGFVPTAAIRALARDLDVSITELVLAVLFHSFQASMHNRKRPLPPSRRRMVRVLVPVSLRNFVKARTLRNFFAFVAPEFDPRLGVYSFPELLQFARDGMRRQLNWRQISQQLARNLRSERHPIGRIVPLSIKNLAMSAAYRFVGDSAYSCSLSNMGRVAMPERMTAKVASVAFVPPPSPTTRANVTVISAGDELCISTGSLLSDRSFEREIYRKLRRLGLPVRISANYN